jgi:sec-independent protein translocase protein TatA
VGAATIEPARAIMRGQRSILGQVPILAIFGLGPTELIVIGLIVLVLFGSRLPKAARGFGQSIKEFKRGVREGNRESSDEAPRQLEHHANAPIDSPSQEQQSHRE